MLYKSAVFYNYINKSPGQSFIKKIKSKKKIFKKNNSAKN